MRERRPKLLYDAIASIDAAQAFIAGVDLAGYEASLPIPVFKTDTKTKLYSLDRDLNDYLATVDQALGPFLNEIDKQKGMIGDKLTRLNVIKEQGNNVFGGIGTYVLLIAILIATGAVVGALKFDKSVIPTQRRGTAVCGGRFLIR